jgi:putative transposase
MILAKKIKLEVSEEDAKTLEFMQAKCRGLYNWWIGKLKSGEKWHGWKKEKKTLQQSKKHDPELEQVYGKLLQEVYFRLHEAMRAFFRRVKAGEKPGFPRVRPRHNFFTLCYPAMYIQIEGNTIRLPTGGKGKKKQYPDIYARLTEEAPTGFKEVAISRDGRGNYYASFPVEVEEENREEWNEEKAKVIAFDLGMKTLAVGTNDQGKVYQIEGFKGARSYNKQLDKIRSKRDKCKKKSRRYIRLSKVYKRVSDKKRNKRQDRLHKASHIIATKLVERTVVVGDLSQKQMVTNEHREHNKYLNRAVYNDWCLYTFIQMLKYKCQRHGKELQILDERNTTKMCSGCGNMQDMPLHKRTYRCTQCGLVMDRDKNSAVNILNRYFNGLAVILSWYTARLGPPTSMEKASMEKQGVLQDIQHEVGVAVMPHVSELQQLRLWK